MPVGPTNIPMVRIEHQALCPCTLIFVLPFGDGFNSDSSRGFQIPRWAYGINVTGKYSSSFRKSVFSQTILHMSGEIEGEIHNLLQIDRSFILKLEASLW